jgi:hypothetical protein
MTDADLRDAERKLYLSYFDDGVLDFLSGLPVLMFGLGMIFDSGLFFLFTFLPLVLYLPLKQAITLPRLGFVRFTPQRRRKISAGLLVMVAAGIAAFVLVLVAWAGFQGRGLDLRGLMMEYGLLVFGAIVASGFLLMSFLFGVRRFAGYAAVVFAGWVGSSLLSAQEGLPVALAGALVSLSGLWIMARFMAGAPRYDE